jgi:hypothetical protein
LVFVAAPLLCDICFAMSKDEAARFRQQVEECLQQAEKAISPLDRETWLRIAKEWIKLAQSVERQRDS